MKDHGLLFKGEMIRAFLREVDPKRQTRRLVTPNNSFVDGISGRSAQGKVAWERLDWSRAWIGAGGDYFWVPRKMCLRSSVSVVTPAIRASDTFYTKECFRSAHPEHPHVRIEYRADMSSWGIADTFNPVTGEAENDAKMFPGTVPPYKPGKWNPSIFMERWMSRIKGTISAVRAQRVQDISEADAKAEGIERHGQNWCNYGRPIYHASNEQLVLARDSYRSLWDSINTDAGDRWQDNPPIWAYTLEVTA